VKNEENLLRPGAPIISTTRREMERKYGDNGKTHLIKPETTMGSIWE
jgi:homoaconitase/3-isopropylmalate dehydratase large subunit